MAAADIASTAAEDVVSVLTESTRRQRVLGAPGVAHSCRRVRR